MNARDEVLQLVKEATKNAYPLRWYDGHGDFDGREVTVDVFNIQPNMQLPFLRDIRGIRDWLKELVGSRCIFIFHTPAATREHYQQIVDSLR